LRNLLANAVDHSDGGAVVLRLAVTEDAIAVAVRDYGVGLRTGEADLVFNRFWRADPSRNRRTGGTGLGLSISQEDARLHGGTLDAWGEPGQGACFRLTLPRYQGKPFQESPLPLPPPDYVPAEPVNGQLPMADVQPAPDAILADREEVGR
jgi:two-component system sensor histidine kinase MtrB